jgi:phosphoserine phosphatase
MVMPDKDTEVIALDLDGVLFDGPSAVQPLASRLGLEQRFLSIFKEAAEKQYGLHQTITEGAKMWIGVPVDGTLDPLVEDLPLMKGAEETVTTLRERGFRVGCISSGVSQFFMKPFKKRLKLDFAFSNILGEEDGKHDGTVEYAMLAKQKAESVLRYLENEGITQKKLASVGDGENDIEMFAVSEFSIAFNPQTERVEEAADISIESEDLRSILPYLECS